MLRVHFAIRHYFVGLIGSSCIKVCSCVIFLKVLNYGNIIVIMIYLVDLFV